MKRKLTAISFCLLSLFSNAQEEVREESVRLKNLHTVYAEVFGQGFSGSLNYDMLFNRDRRWKNSFSVGVVAIPRAMQFGDGAYLGVMGSYNWLIGGKRNFLELGIGLSTQLADGYSFQSGSNQMNQLYTYMTPKIGYRFQAYKSGLFFRATLTPQISLVNTSFDRSYMNNSFTTTNTFFSNVLNLGYPAMPWFGLSIGYSF